SYLVQLAADEAEAARQNLRQLVEGFHHQHFWATYSGGEIALFSGDAKTAWNLIRHHWAGLKGSGLIRIRFYRTEMLHLRAREAVASAVRARGSAGRFYLRSAQRDTRRITREGTPWGAALARLVRAGIASVEKTPTEARSLVETAERELNALDMALYAAVARR